MSVSIRDHAILDSATARLEELIDACRRGGGLHAHAPHLAEDVMRKAKKLRTSLAGLQASLEPGAQIAEEEKPGRKAALLYRLYASPLLYEMVRFVGRGGRSEIEFWDFYREFGRQYSQEKASAAVAELFDFDKTTLPAVVRIKPKVLPLCSSLLGPRPENEPSREEESGGAVIVVPATVQLSLDQKRLCRQALRPNQCSGVHAKWPERRSQPSGRIHP